MKSLSLLGAVIQLAGFAALGCIPIRLTLTAYSHSMLWWEWPALLTLAWGGRHLLREGLAIHTLSLPPGQRPPSR